MTTRNQQTSCQQSKTPSPFISTHNRSDSRASKRRIFQHSALCLSLLILSFSATGVALAFVDLGDNKRVTDTIKQTVDKNTLGQIDNKSIGQVVGIDDKDVQNIEQSIGTVKDYLRTSQEFYRNITHKNIPGILGQLESVLGQMGIPSPRIYAEKIDDILNRSSSGSTPTMPEQIYGKQQTVTDTANSDSFWIYTDSVLGNGENEGQSRLSAMNQTSAASVEASLKGQSGSLSQSQQAIGHAEIAAQTAASVEQLSAQAQQRNVSQDVFKDVAAQQSELAKSNSAISNQLSTLSQQQAIAAAQAGAIARAQQVGNEHLSQLQVGQAIGNVQLHDIFNAQRHANQMQIIESEKNTQVSLGSTDAIYIPGLFSKQAGSN